MLTADSRRFCVAPMMDLTDRHCRYFHRLLSRRALLYTEMVTTGALIYGDVDRHLGYHEAEHPLALQLGGSEPADLARCARMAEDRGYDEVNLNCGCPSDRVQNGSFGACLMKDPGRVADCVAAMKEAVDLPITVKCRIGVDDRDSYQELLDFSGRCLEAGSDALIVHARKAWLQGLSPRENREIPPLDYQRVYQLKADLGDAEIILNGGIENLDQAEQLLEQVDGVMLGRSAYYHPSMLMEVDRRFFDAPATPELDSVMEEMRAYIDSNVGDRVRVASITRHMLGLFQGIPGAKRFRRTLSEEAPRPEATSAVLARAYAELRAPLH